jgi:hypothetical protein
MQVTRGTVNIKQNLHSQVKTTLTNPCPNWEYAAGAHLLKMQRVQNKSSPRYCTPDCAQHVALKIPCVYDYITKLLYRVVPLRQ